jgi:ElaB/YqjD/DUF883 family membrane-anchored ribosome-binding protein
LVGDVDKARYLPSPLNEDTTMINKTLHAAESLFKRTGAEQGSDAAKLQEFRARQVLRKRETKLTEIKQRLEKRNSGPCSSVFAR